MEISELTIRIIILLIPGLIGTRIEEISRDKKKMDIREFIVSVLLIGFISYFIFLLLINIKNIFMYGIKNFSVEEIYFFKGLVNSDINIKWSEVIGASVISIFLGLITAIMFNKGFLYMLLRKLKITNSSGKDVWLELFDNDTKGLNKYIKIIDEKNDILYYGWVKNYSNDPNHPELILKNVTIAKNSKRTKKIREVKELYIEIEKKNMIIEIGE